MKKPPIILLLIAGMLVLYGIQVILFATNQNNAISLNYIWAAMAFIAAAGLSFNKSWSQYLVFFFAFTMSAQWVYFVWLINRNGWRYDDSKSIIISLLPGVFLITACICSSIYVFMYFKRVKET